MEDRTIVACPVSGRPSWSFFAVCDGHGGCYSSSFLAENLHRIISTVASNIGKVHHISNHMNLAKPSHFTDHGILDM
jgi:serine/threonine protein phosphatase PrpC